MTVWAPAKPKKRKRNVPMNSPRKATVSFLTILDVGICGLGIVRIHEGWYRTSF